MAGHVFLQLAPPSQVLWLQALNDDRLHDCWRQSLLRHTRGVEAYVPYLYDSRGNPRWVIALSNLPNNGVIPMFQFDGQCPDCAYQPGSGVPVGTLTRSFTSPRLGNGRFEIQLAPPLAGSAVTEAPIARLTDDLACGR